ncbi:ExbD/TolR family protein [Agaribacterium sp. ZY112]|uniref:ExbD/TolR family protein n=1 Tax=Agaribacterium sp. ZY112 TaxID=3233574 RepID=UPI00352509F9
MARSQSAADEEAGAIDLTPMLDVVFIMLIFFIVTASFVKEPGIEVDRPDATTVSAVKTPILIAISDENVIWVNKNEVDSRGVKRQIEVLLADTPKGKVVIQADKSANIKTMAEVAQAAREAGVAEITVSANSN